MRSWRKRLFPVLVVLCLSFAFLASPAYAAEVQTPAHHTPTQSTSKQVTPFAVSGGGCYTDSYDSVCISLNSEYQVVADVYIHACFQGFTITLFDDYYGPQGEAIYLSACSGHFYGPRIGAYSGGAFWTCLSGTLANGRSEYNCSPTQYT